MFDSTDILVKHQRFKALPPLMQHGIVGGPIDTSGDYPKPIFLQIQESSNVLSIVGTPSFPLRLLFSNGINNNSWDNFIKTYQTTENITIDQSCYIYAEVDDEFDDIRFKTLPIYNNIIYTHTEPSIKYDGDYWFDVDDNQMKIFNSSEQQYVATQRWDEITQSYINTSIIILGQVIVGLNSFVLEYWYPNKGISEFYQNKYLSALNPNSDEAVNLNIYRFRQRVNYAFSFTYDYNFQYDEQIDIPDFRFGEHNNTSYTVNGIERNNVNNFGYRITPDLDLTPLGFVNMTKISWVSSGDITIEGAISFDNGATFSEWQSCINNESFLQLVSGVNLENVVVKFKQNLNDETSVLESFTFLIDSTNKDLTGDISVQDPINVSPMNSAIIDEYPFSLQINDDFATNGVKDYLSSVKFRIKKQSSGEVVYETNKLYDNFYEHIFNEPWDLSVELGTNYIWQIQHNTRVYGLSSWSSDKQFYLKNLTQPINQSPQDGDLLTKFPLTLKTNGYLPHHIKSRWQILDETDTVVYDSNESDDLTEHTISELWTGFAFDHTYKFRVQYKSEKYQSWSIWSNATEFVFKVYKPENISPINNTRNILIPITLESDMHDHYVLYSQFIVEKNSSVVYDSGEIIYSNIHEILSLWAEYSLDTTYQWKVRHKSEFFNVYSEWSDLSNFIIPSIQKPVNLSYKNSMNEIEFPICLKSSKFILTSTSIDLSHYHEKSRYKITKISNGSVIYESGIVSDLTEHNVITELNLTETDVQYQWQVQYMIATYNFWSEWSEPTIFIVPSVTQPLNVEPINQTQNIIYPLTLKSNQFKMNNSGNYPHSHGKSQWQIFKKPENTLVYDSGTVDDLTSHIITDVWSSDVTGSEYEWQVKHKAKYYNLWSEFSNRTSFNILSLKPKIVATQPGVLPELIPLTFRSSNMDYHSKSQWIIQKKSDGTIVYDSGETTDDLTSITITEDIVHNDWQQSILENTTYQCRVRYYSDMYAVWSQWSNFTEFTTPLLSPIIPDMNMISFDRSLSLDDFPVSLQMQTQDPLNYCKTERVIFDNDTDEVVYDYTGSFDPNEEEDTNNDLIFNVQLWDDMYDLANKQFYWKYRKKSTLYNVYTQWSLKSNTFNINNNYDFQDFETTGDTYISSDQDGDTVYKFYNNLKINTGHLFTTSNRCKGLVIYCEGDCEIDGILSMTSRGSRGYGRTFTVLGMHNVLTESGTYDLTIAPVGGLGGARRGGSDDFSFDGYAGDNGVDGACGGGGSGKVVGIGTDNYIHSGAGANGTSWSGGAGGGGGVEMHTAYNSGDDAESNGGSGGDGHADYRHSAGGGAGNPGGSGDSSNDGTFIGNPGQTGTGGLLVLIVKGKLVINGIIESNGMQGGSASLSGGGSSGGGTITSVAGLVQNNGVINAYGGSSQSGGGKGGDGSVRIYRSINDGVNSSDVIISKPQNNNTLLNTQFPLTLKSKKANVNKINNMYTDFHTKSRWQILDSVTEQIMYDSGEITDLYEHTLSEPWNDINILNKYQWKVQYKTEIFNIYSEWSDLYDLYFITNDILIDYQGHVLIDLNNNILSKL